MNTQRAAAREFSSAWRQVLGYGAAVFAVAAGYGLRLAIEAGVGAGLPTYITFYPLVMAVALLVGFGPGLVATALTAMTAAVWILPPIGQLAIASPVDRLGLVFFSAMGLFMSAVAELYRRDRRRAAACEREAALREGEEALRRQTELIDPIRAEIIAREMQRVVRERGGPGAAPPVPTGETLGHIPGVAGAAVACVGLLVVIGWTFGCDALTSVVPGMARMKVNTALCFVLAGAALALRERRALRVASAAIVAAVSALSLGEYATGADFGMDQMWISDPGDLHTVPGRMAQATGISFILASVSLLLVGARARAALWVQQGTAVTVGAFGMVALLGYGYGVQQLYGLAGFSSMALNTAASLVVLAVGLSFARGDGLSAVLTTPGPSAQLARRMLPGAILVPAIVGWLCVLGSQAGLFEPNFGTGLFAITMMIGFASLVWWTALAIIRTDAARRETERQLRNLAEVMDHAHQPLIVLEPDGVIRAWNLGAEALYGWSAAEAVGRRKEPLLHTEGRSVEEVARELESTGQWEGELINTARDGRRVTVESRQTASRIGDGQVFILEGNLDITERKRQEEAILRAKDEWERTFDTVPDLIAILDERHHVVRANRAMAVRLGVRPEQCVGLPCYKAVHGTDEPPAFCPHARTLRDGREHTSEIHEDRLGGDFLVTTTPMFSPEGRITGSVHVARDITERKHAETERQKFVSLADQSTEFIGMCDMNFMPFYINEAGRRLVGLDGIEEAFLTPVKEFFFPEDQRFIYEEFVPRVLREGRAEVEIRFRHFKTGEALWMICNVFFIRDSQGKPVGLATVSRDITTRKRAEEALRESREDLNRAQEVGQIGSWRLDVRRNLLTWSDENWRIFGVPKGTPLAYETFLGAVHPDDRDYVHAKWTAALKGEPYDIEHRIVSGDKIKWVRERAELEFDSQGGLLGGFGTSQDITLKKDAEEALAAAKAAAEAANLAKSRFLANMSHELRTPMNAILGMIDVALPKAKDPAVLDCLQTARGSADLLLTLLDGLLDSAKIESGRLELETAPFSLRRMLDQIARVVAVRASEKGLRFACRTADDAPDAVIGDRMRLQQVLLNLAGNAIKFTVQGAVEIRVRSESLDGDACLEFAVVDTGIGIPAAHMDKLFRPFIQSDASTARRFGGTGLGLAICKSLVELMGGRISAESEVGKGSTFRFTIRLPLAEEIPAEFEAPVVVAAGSRVPLRILLVEDNPANQKLATYILQDRGHAVEIAEDGEEAIRVAGEGGYDVILMDVQMPGMDGLEATAAIRRRETAGNRVPIIAMTAHAMKGDRERCLAAGMDGYLSKPINPREVIGLVESMGLGAGRTPGTLEARRESTAAVFDLQAATTSCLKRQDMLRKMIHCFFDEADALLPQMRAALKKGNLDEVGALGHRMKGTVVYLGAQPATEAARSVERFWRGRAGTRSEAEVAVDSLEHECGRLRAELVEHLRRPARRRKAVRKNDGRAGKAASGR